MSILIRVTTLWWYSFHCSPHAVQCMYCIVMFYCMALDVAKMMMFIISPINCSGAVMSKQWCPNNFKIYNPVYSCTSSFPQCSASSFPCSNLCQCMSAWHQAVHSWWVFLYNVIIFGRCVGVVNNVFDCTVPSRLLQLLSLLEQALSSPASHLLPCALCSVFTVVCFCSVLLQFYAVQCCES